MGVEVEFKLRGTNGDSGFPDHYRLALAPGQ